MPRQPSSVKEKPASKPGKPLSQKALKAYLDDLVSTYQTPDFIPSDPVRFPHRYREDARACELVGFLAAMMSYGRRDKILETVENILLRMDHDPMGYVENFKPKREVKRYDDFVYRFNRGADLVFLFQRLQWAYREFGSLENLFLNYFNNETHEESPLQSAIGAFIDQLLDGTDGGTHGLKFLFAHPKNGGACKRFNMFLRWMVRDDAPLGTSGVDLGVWKQGLRARDLVIPLDTHVAQSARRLGLTRRNANDWRTAEEITAAFRKFCPEDPIRYDFALFGLGVFPSESSTLKT